MIEIDAISLKKLQKIELEMLVEIDRICRKHDIKYTIFGGTLLGAVREKGFIAWDDDADVAMLRPEYEKFCKACEKELDKDRFYFQDNRNTRGYRWGYGKVRRKDTLFLREHQEHMPYEQGVFVDIFPIDNIPKTYIGRAFFNFKCFCVRKILWSEVGKTADKRKFMRGWFRVINRIPEKKVFSYYEKMIVKCNRKETGYARQLMWPMTSKLYGYKKEWFENLCEYEFEGHKFWGIRNYDEWLTFIYGDYMTPPPVEKRKVHPVSKLELGV